MPLRIYFWQEYRIYINLRSELTITCVPKVRLAVYFGSVGIRKERHALACGLFSDLVAIIVAIVVAYWFFH